MITKRIQKILEDVRSENYNFILASKRGVIYANNESVLFNQTEYEPIFLLKDKEVIDVVITFYNGNVFKINYSLFLKTQNLLGLTNYILDETLSYTDLPIDKCSDLEVNINSAYLNFQKYFTGIDVIEKQLDTPTFKDWGL